MLPLIISFCGILVGMFLAWLVPEEIEPGRRYFFIVQQALLAVLILVSFFFLKNLFLPKNFFVHNSLLFFPLFLSAVIFLLNFYFKHSPNPLFIIFLSMLPYLLFAFVYFQSNYYSFKLTLASLLFLYGLPTGTLLWNLLLNKRDEK